MLQLQDAPFDQDTPAALGDAIHPLTGGARPRSDALRVAAVLGGPWVTSAHADLGGLEVDAVRRYSAWRQRPLELVACSYREALALLRARRVCLVIGGLADTPALAEAGERAHYSRRPLRIGDPSKPLRASHVWGVSRSFGRERRHLEFFLQAHQRYAG